MAILFGRRVGDTYVLPAANTKIVSKFITGATPLSINHGGVLGYLTGDPIVKSRIVIYDTVDQSTPANLIASSDELVGIAAENNGYTFAQPVLLAPNTAYFVGVHVDRSVRFYAQAGGVIYVGSDTYSDGPSSPFGSGGEIPYELAVWLMDASAELLVGKAGALAVLSPDPILTSESVAATEAEKVGSKYSFGRTETATAAADFDSTRRAFRSGTQTESASATDTYPAQGFGYRQGTVGEYVSATTSETSRKVSSATLSEAASLTDQVDKKISGLPNSLSEGISATEAVSPSRVSKGANLSESQVVTDAVAASLSVVELSIEENVSATESIDNIYLDSLIFSPTSTITISALTAAPKKLPLAVLTSQSDYTVIGSVVVLDGRASIDPDGTGLTYTFSFLTVPIGSRVALEGFRKLDDTGGSVSFSPDVVGQYIIGLIVSNGNFDSEMASFVVDVRATMVPHARGMVPDGKFIWSYLRDVWTQVDGKDFFETLWSALVQISGADLLKLYENDYNKSIADIQELYQRRWLHYEPKLDIVAEDCSFVFGKQSIGQSASTAESSTGTTDWILIPRHENFDLSSVVHGQIVVVGSEARTVARTTGSNVDNKARFDEGVAPSVELNSELVSLRLVVDTSMHIFASNQVGMLPTSWYATETGDIQPRTLISPSTTFLIAQYADIGLAGEVVRADLVRGVDDGVHYQEYPDQIEITQCCTLMPGLPNSANILAIQWKNAGLNTGLLAVEELELPGGAHLGKFEIYQCEYVLSLSLRAPHNAIQYSNMLIKPVL